MGINVPLHLKARGQPRVSFLTLRALCYWDRLSLALLAAVWASCLVLPRTGVINVYNAWLSTQVLGVKLGSSGLHSRHPTNWKDNSLTRRKHLQITYLTKDSYLEYGCLGPQNTRNVFLTLKIQLQMYKRFENMLPQTWYTYHPQACEIMLKTLCHWRNWNKAHNRRVPGMKKTTPPSCSWGCSN